jgi:hypothetical protein
VSDINKRRHAAEETEIAELAIADSVGGNEDNVTETHTRPQFPDHCGFFPLVFSRLSSFLQLYTVRNGIQGD